VSLFPRERVIERPMAGKAVHGRVSVDRILLI
jgi:hypothetical protein